MEMAGLDTMDSGHEASSPRCTLPAHPPARPPACLPARPPACLPAPPLFSPAALQRLPLRQLTGYGLDSRRCTRLRAALLHRTLHPEPCTPSCLVVHRPPDVPTAPVPGAALALPLALLQEQQPLECAVV